MRQQKCKLKLFVCRFLYVIIVSANLVPALVKSENCNVQLKEDGNFINLNDSQLAPQHQREECGGVYEVDEFIVHSPGYPNGYPPNSDCVYRFQGEQCNRRYQFRMEDFDLEYSAGCTKDRLEVQDKDALCGSVFRKKEYRSVDGQLRLRFLSDSEGSGRGFRILVTRSPCNGEFDGDLAVQLDTTIVPLPIYPTSPRPPPIYPTTPPTYPPPIFPPHPPPHPPPQPPPGGLPACCAQQYSGRHFMIASPEFPRTNTVPQRSDCVYRIRRANRNICRLRMHLVFFWSGGGSHPSDAACGRGFLEIDGRRLCGCRSGLNIVSHFDSTWGDAPKVLRFRNVGYPQTQFSGFVVEVIQDECPDRYVYCYE